MHYNQRTIQVISKVKIDKKCVGKKTHKNNWFSHSLPFIVFPVLSIQTQVTNHLQEPFYDPSNTTL